MNKISALLATVGMLLPLLSAFAQSSESPYQIHHGAIVRGDSSRAELALVFTGDEYAEGGEYISGVLTDQGIQGSFFLTGKFYRNPEFKALVKDLLDKGHYLGPHSDQHLLYCDWEQRDSLLLTQEEFSRDLQENYRIMKSYGIRREDARLFIPPYEWYNDTIARWTRAMGLVLINITYGTLSHADYTLPGSAGYRSSEEIYRSILEYEAAAPNGLNGFILLIHIGTASERTDKFYVYLESLIEELKSRSYSFKRIDEMLSRIIP